MQEITSKCLTSKPVHISSKQSAILMLSMHPPTSIYHDFVFLYDIVDETMNMTHLLRYVVRFSSIHFLRVNFPVHMSPVSKSRNPSHIILYLKFAPKSLTLIVQNPMSRHHQSA